MTTKPAGCVTPPQEDRPFALGGAVQRLRPGGHEGLATDSAGPLVVASGPAAAGMLPGNLLSNSPDGGVGDVIEVQPVHEFSFPKPMGYHLRFRRIITLVI
jgi:hypothetical protein